MRSKTLILLFLLTLNACQNESGELSGQKTASNIGRVSMAIGTFGISEMGPTAEELRARDKETCRSFGFKEGTKEFSHCALSLYSARMASGPAVMVKNPPRQSMTCQQIGSFTECN